MSQKVKSLYELWVSLQRFLNIKGGTIIGLFSMEMLAIIAFYACKGHDLPATVRDVYLGVVTAFTVHTTAKVVKGTKDDDTTTN